MCSLSKEHNYFCLLFFGMHCPAKGSDSMFAFVNVYQLQQHTTYSDETVEYQKLSIVLYVSFTTILSSVALLGLRCSSTISTRIENTKMYKRR